jgi:hypothetical protein
MVLSRYTNSLLDESSPNSALHPPHLRYPSYLSLKYRPRLSLSISNNKLEDIKRVTENLDGTNIGIHLL